MNFKRYSVIGASILAVGCAINTAVLTPSTSKSTGTMSTYSDGNGVSRTFSFNYDRAVKQEATRAVTHYVSRAALPATIDLRANCSPVGDQGHLGSCTAWSMARGLREYMENKNHETYTQLSPLYFYYKEREIEDTVSEDSGATITDGMTVLSDTGVCPETDWPYDVAKFAVKPSATAETDAAKFKVANAISIKGSTFADELNQVKSQLASGNTVAFGFRVFKSFMGKDVAATGIMPMPQPSEQVMGGHAVLAVGYDDAKKVLIVRNSWGTAWGDKGYFYMPYDNMKYNHDFWTAQ